MILRPLRGARLAPGERAGGLGNSIAQYERVIALFQFKSRDRVHYPLAETLVNFAMVALKVGGGEEEWFADHDRDRAKTQSASAARQSFVRAEDPHRHHRGERFSDDKADAGQGGLQVSIERARALRKNEHAMILAEDANEGLERAAIGAFLIDEDNIELGQDPAERGNIEKRFAREKINRAPAADSGKRRIEIALVIHGQNHRPFLNDSLGMNDPEAKEDFRDESGEMVDRVVPGIHDAIVRP